MLPLVALVGSRTCCLAHAFHGFPGGFSVMPLTLMFAALQYPLLTRYEATG